MNRRKDNRWILQKNIRTSQIMLDFIDSIRVNSNNIDYETLIQEMNQHDYSNITSQSTLGVRMSQMAFYMLGYKSSDKFVPSFLTQKLLRDEIEVDKYALLNLYSMQYPHPFSDTSSNFRVYIGRLLVKLLLDDRLNRRLYIDELGWFIPFIETINQVEYEELIQKIIEYRNKTFDEKSTLFESIHNYDDVFSNTFHEMNYYFLRIFNGFGVVELCPDREHNNGRLFKFKHGDTETYRNDAYQSRASISGYVQISDNLIECAEKLNANYSPFDLPATQGSSISREYWLKDLYEFNMINYMATIDEIDNPDIIVNNMIHLSKFGSNDGRDFESAVKEVMDLFDERVHTEIISGSGDTDILCVFNLEDRLKKFNVDSKKTGRTLSQINPVRINNHLELNNSEYAIIVTSRFSRGANRDINGYRIVNIDAETLGKYILKNYNNNGEVKFEHIDMIITSNLGTNISNRIEYLTDSLFN